MQRCTNGAIISNELPVEVSKPQKTFRLLYVAVGSADNTIPRKDTVDLWKFALLGLHVQLVTFAVPLRHGKNTRISSK